MIRNATIKDAKTIAEIYNYYILNAIATFEEVPISETYFKDKIEKATEKHPWFVYEIDGNVIGYAYGSSWNTRSAYNKTTEVSIYLKHDVVEKGVGSQLYNHLITHLINQKNHVLIGGISLPNEVSQRLHEKFGFEKVAHFKKVGFKFNKWIDVGYWQLTIDQNK